MNESTGSKQQVRRERPPLQWEPGRMGSTAGEPRPGHAPPDGGRHPVEGYWEDWTPTDPQPHTGYDAELHLPPGAYLVNACASVCLGSDAAGPSELECSLFVGAVNVSLHQSTLSPGEGESLAATAHVDAADTTVVQWVCSSSTGPFQLSLGVTAIKVDRLYHRGR
jgi:hypothetical protein